MITPNRLRALLVAVLAATLPPATAFAGHLLDVRFERRGAQVVATLELDSPAPFAAATAPDGLSVTIALPDAEAKTAAPRALDKLAPVTGYSVGPGARPRSSQVNITTDRPVEVVSATRPPQGAGGKRHRIVITLGAAKVAAPVKPPPAPAPAAAPAAAPPAPVAAPPLPPPMPALVPPPDETEARPPGRRLEIPAEARPAPLPPETAAKPPSPVDAARIERLLADAGKAQESGNSARALALYHEAADAGSPVGAFALGQIYRLGAGVEINATLAAFWYGEAAKAGYPPAEMNLGVMQLRGLGLHPDATAGLAMIRRAAAHGNGPAQDLLAEIERAQPGGARKGAP